MNHGIEKLRKEKARRAEKETSGKLPYALIPPGPLEELVRVYQYGAEKYAPRNWERGLPWLECYEALMRHVQEWRKGEDIDPESGRRHMAHAAWWCFALLHYDEAGVGVDDR